MIHARSVLAIVPARGGSKGLPGKNIFPVGGKPMIAWTIEAARHSKYIDRVVLSSDDPAIINVARDCGCEVPFVRPAELARDDTPAVDVVLHALDQLPAHDITVLLQPTSPLRDQRDIDAAIETMLASGSNSCVSVCEAEKSPYWMYTTAASGRLQPLLDPELSHRQRQQLPKVYVLNGATYVIETACLRAARRFVTVDTVAYVMPKERSVDVDYELDAHMADYLLRHCS